MFIVRRYVSAAGRDVFGDWLVGLNDVRARARIQVRIDRVEAGNFGDCFPVGSGVQELRVDYGPGYRVYFGMSGRAVVLLLCGGDKSTQKADIKNAIRYLKDYKEREK